jgi:multidrug efflux system membrane fusion protein
MRYAPILTALIVAAFMYVFIMERDWLNSFAGSAGAQETDTAQSEDVKVAAARNGAVSVVAMRSKAQTISSGIVLRGRTEAARNVDVRAETTGLVISEPLPKGTVVQAGTTLCELDVGTKNAQLVTAKAVLAEAEANNKAAASLAERGFTAETTAIARVAQLESARAAVEQAEKELEKLTITAPFDGLLESDTAELGALLQPGSACAKIIDLNPIKIVGFVPERDVNRLTIGADAGARLVSGKEIFGQLTFVSRSADPLTRTFRVEVSLPNDDLAIRDGLTAEIFISLAGEKAHLLPQSVLTLNDEGRLGIRAAVDGVARFFEVELIRDSAEGVWLGGLDEQLDVIVVGQEFVVDGRAIDVSMRN